MASCAPILLVEDDPAQRFLLGAYLRQGGFALMEAGSLAEARAALTVARPALVLLDLILPDGDGMDLVRELRRQDLPLIIVSSREVDRIDGLERGADDYLTKPYNPRELAARVHNLLRRSGADRDPDVLELGPYRLDVYRRLLGVQGGGEVALTRGEFNLLAELASAQGRVLGRAQLAEAINPDGETASLRSVDVLISRLRTKLEKDPGSPRLVLTVAGCGYRLGA